MKMLKADWKVYTDPTYPRGGPLFLFPQPPSAVERLAALDDPELAEKIKKYDDQQEKLNRLYGKVTVDDL